MRRVLSSAFVVVLATVCQYQAALASDKFVTIILPGPESEYTKRLLLGAQRASHDLDIDLKQSFIASTEDSERQISFLKGIINDRPAGIIIAPSAYPGIENILKDISELPAVIGVGPVRQQEGQLPTVMNNNFAAGTLAADVIGQRAAGEEGNVAWIGSKDTDESQGQRANGFVQWISKKYPNLRITSIDNSDNPDFAYRSTKEFISTSIAAKGIFATSEEAALGVGRAIEDLKQSAKVPVVGFGSTEGLMNLLDHNIISGLVAPDTYQIGYEAVVLAVDRYNGKKVPTISEVAPSLLLPTRQFAQPHDFPPFTTAAYGIVAFPQGSTPDQQERMRSICEAYYETFPRSSEVLTPLARQMITVWPIDSPQSLIQISNKSGDVETCKLAVEHYGLTTSLTAIKEAESTNTSLKLIGSGPFLLGWAPSSEKGKKDTLVLTVDLSGANTTGHYLEYFREWRDDIEQKPEVWNNGWTLEKVRLAIRDGQTRKVQCFFPHGPVTKD
jgi:ribose transport system substrate-binding protein